MYTCMCVALSYNLGMVNCRELSKVVEILTNLFYLNLHAFACVCEW